MEVRKTVLVAHSAECMFDLIEGCEHYPDFLPWCSSATVVTRDENSVIADITVNYYGVRFDFRTRNPKRRPNWMAIYLERGPFRHFDGVWDLKALATDGCRIDFLLHYDFDSTAMAKIARPVFDRIANTLVDRFVARADQLQAAEALWAPDAPAAAEAPRSLRAAGRRNDALDHHAEHPAPHPCADSEDSVNRSDPS